MTRRRLDSVARAQSLSPPAGHGDLFDDADVEAALLAVRLERAAYHEARRSASNELYGHPGAHIGTIPYPDDEALVRAVLRAVESRRA